MDNNEMKLLITVAQLYYEQNLTQIEIANKLSIYRTTISRLLKKAQEQGVVTISVNYGLSQTFVLEKKLKEQFNLQHVIVVNHQIDDTTEQKLKLMGQAGAQYLKQITQDGNVLGFSWGSSLAALAEQLDNSEYKKIICIPMVGGPAGKLESQYHVNTIVYNIASKLHGDSLLMDFPAILDEQYLRDAIVKSKHYQQIVAYWDRITIAVFGIGSCYFSDKSIWHGFYGEGGQVQSIDQQPIAGDICSRFYDMNGNPIQTSISDTIINISLSQLIKAKYRIGIAHSIEKAEAIIGAMKGGYLNTLITTQETAQAILDKKLSPD